MVPAIFAGVLVSSAEAQIFNFTFDSPAGPDITGYVNAADDNLYITSWTESGGFPEFLVPEASEFELVFSAFEDSTGFPLPTGNPFDITSDFLNEFESGQVSFFSDKLLSEIDWVGGTNTQGLNMKITDFTGDQMNFQFVALAGGANGSTPGRVSFTPEPSSTMLTVLAALGFISGRRR